MNEEIKTGIALIASFFMVMTGLFRLFTDQIEEMSLMVAYVFIFTGLIGVVSNALKWKRREK